ncbi:single-stranded DNA-binding protein [Peptostreptococcus equinus]|uniref:Single-stranded DNA-binding protein n=1 Tax=Peptostreptococcus equinus TaxID=3003601 RepID=A0ABY7JR85_9FIRM|nr:single-stranded DNA-binding protein [Peptostreptococcus sp. CBA3647]WAW15880.1 single-stranded DNA-binding protein [Peptostreptococcus sp. CBA3647]
MNNVVICGRLCKDPELRYIPGSGTPVATFTLAIDRDYKNKDGSTTTDFIPVEIMGKPAEFCANYITKGRLVGIQGSIRVDRYETPEGEKRNFTKVAGRIIKALEYKKQTDESNNGSPSQFSAVDDDDVPF